MAWLSFNQHQLGLALDGVRRALEQHMLRQAGSGAGAKRSTPDRPASAADLPALELGTLPPPALDTLCAAYALSPFERDVLLLCAGVELDSEFHAACGAAQGIKGRAAPTFGMALAALPNPHWSALAPHAPLRRGCLIQVLPGDSLTQSPLRIDERVLHYLTGVSAEESLDPRLRALLFELPAPTPLSPMHQQLVGRLLSRVTLAEDPRPCLLLCGPDAAARSAVAATVCGELGIPLYCMHSSEVPQSASDRELCLRLWEREVLLEGCALLVHFDDAAASDGDSRRTLLSFIERLPGLVLMSSHDSVRSALRPIVRFDVPQLSLTEQVAEWHATLGASAARLGGHIDRLAAHFSLGQQSIRTIAAEALAESGLTDRSLDAHATADTLGRALWNASRAQARPHLDDLAQRIESRAGWNDLILPKAQLKVLRAIVDHKQHQGTVHQRWGFADRGGRGLGLSVLFAGASGTGKTLAAEVLAGAMQLDLYRIDLSQIVSKYIGETEKNLGRVFEAAEQGGVVLLFDEADALFGKRSEVRDSHDRHANIEVSYLLQRMESYRGVSILTTNFKAAIDGAFLRRIRFIVNFPTAEVAQRVEIWRRMIPPMAPTEDLDFAKLARLSISGGHIQNIALTAAFAAAAAGEPLRMRHLQEAAQLEYAKLDRAPSELEFER